MRLCIPECEACVRRKRNPCASRGNASSPPDPWGAAATLRGMFTSSPLTGSKAEQYAALAAQARALLHGDNLHIVKRPDAPVRVLLTGHMDTVFSADHAFQGQQWLDDGILNGPGVADMKGGIAVMLSALMV